MNKNKKDRLFQPLTYIRQLGTHRSDDGTICYTFIAHISRDVAPIEISMTITPSLNLSIQGQFNEELHSDDLDAQIERFQQNIIRSINQTPLQPTLLDAV